MKKKKTLMMDINETSKIFKDHIRKISDENNLTECYRPIVFFLSHFKALTQCDLVHYTRLKAPTISLTLQKMENDGYVERITAEDDARKIYVSLTDKGNEYNERMIELITQDEEIVLSCLTDDEKKQLEEILTKIKRKMCQEFGEFKHEDF